MKDLEELLCDVTLAHAVFKGQVELVLADHGLGHSRLVSTALPVDVHLQLGGIGQTLSKGHPVGSVTEAVGDKPDDVSGLLGKALGQVRQRHIRLPSKVS